MLIKRRGILRTAAEYGASNVRVFGSAARGDADEQSDLHLLVDMEAGRSLFDMGGLFTELEEPLGCSVDIVTEEGLRELFENVSCERRLYFEGFPHGSFMTWKSSVRLHVLSRKSFGRLILKCHVDRLMVCATSLFICTLVLIKIGYGKW